MDATLGKDYQRPFELATLRLTNMAAILRDWEALAPADDSLLTQRGGCFIFQNGEEKVRRALTKSRPLSWLFSHTTLTLFWQNSKFRHVDLGILGYCPVARLVEKALSDDPAASPDPVKTIRQAAADKTTFVDDVFQSIAALEKKKVEKGELKVRIGPFPNPDTLFYRSWWLLSIHRNIHDWHFLSLIVR
jgi:hypothetical protein